MLDCPNFYATRIPAIDKQWKPCQRFSQGSPANVRVDRNAAAAGYASAERRGLQFANRIGGAAISIIFKHSVASMQ